MANENEAEPVRVKLIGLLMDANLRRERLLAEKLRLEREIADLRQKLEKARRSH
jgi:hypothetical protein